MRRPRGAQQTQAIVGEGLRQTSGQRPAGRKKDPRTRGAVHRPPPPGAAPLSLKEVPFTGGLTPPRSPTQLATSSSMLPKILVRDRLLPRGLELGDNGQRHLETE